MSHSQDSPHLEVLIAPSSTDPIGQDSTEFALRSLYAYPKSTPWVRSNMVTTLDGAICGPDATSKSINNAADMRVFRVLRSLADVIVVGSATAAEMDYQRIELPSSLSQIREAAGLRPQPQLAVVSRSGQLPSSVLNAKAEPIVITSQNGARANSLAARLRPERLIQLGETTLDIAALPRALATRGLERILCEGGPTFLSAIAEAQVLDEIALTIAPTIAGGSAPRLISGPWLMNQLTLKLLLRSQSTLIGLWRVDQSGSSNLASN